MLNPGTNIGRYVVTNKLTEGGMAEIYLARAIGPEGFSKEVVIKVVRSFLASDSQFVKMFIDEARLASQLNHANVVQIFDFGKHEDTYYLAMEYVRGSSLWELRQRCRKQAMPFPITLAAEIAMQIARGLQYAHNLTNNGNKLGVVHRDVTPHNVLLSFDGAVKLTDFGIAKATTTHTAPGMLKGKFAYMSPEQARGDVLDARTDIFALGIVLWELLTGGRLFDGDSDLAVLRAVENSIIAPPVRLNAEVPEDLSDIVMRALARSIQERFQSAFELERALATWVLRTANSIEDTNVALFLASLYPSTVEPEDTAPLPHQAPHKETVSEYPKQTITPLYETRRNATPAPQQPQQVVEDCEAAEELTLREGTAQMPAFDASSSPDPSEAYRPPSRRLSALPQVDPSAVVQTPSPKTPASKKKRILHASPPAGIALLVLCIGIAWYFVTSATQPSAQKELVPQPVAKAPSPPSRKAAQVQQLRLAQKSAAAKPQPPPEKPAAQPVVKAQTPSPSQAAPPVPIPSPPLKKTPPLPLPAAQLRPTQKSAATKPQPEKPSPSPPPLPTPTPRALPVQKRRSRPQPIAAVKPQAVRTKKTSTAQKRKKAAKAATGRVSIRAVPYADVFDNNVRLAEELQGTKVFSLKAGKHVLIFKHPAKTEKKKITVKANKTISVNFEAL